MMEHLLPGDGGPGPSWPASILRLARFYLAHPEADGAAELRRYGLLGRGFLGDSAQAARPGRRSPSSTRLAPGSKGTTLPLTVN